MPHALNRLAALERTGVALPTGDGGVGVLGSTECSQGEKSEGRDTREHCEMSKAVQLGAVRLDEIVNDLEALLYSPALGE